MLSTARAILLAAAGVLPAGAHAGGGEVDKWAIKSAGEAAGRLQIVLRAIET